MRVSSLIALVAAGGLVVAVPLVNDAPSTELVTRGNILCGLLGKWIPSCSPPKNWCPASYTCDKSGNDGYDYDSNGKGCPYPGLGWKYYGESCGGWQPPKNWQCPSNQWTPPQPWIPKCPEATWWSPPPSWQHPMIPSPPAWWPKPSGPPKNWCPASYTCDKSGNDGYDYDSNGKGCPYAGVPWKYFGESCGGWQPPKGYQPPSSSWGPPPAWVPSCQDATWWSPPSSWQHPSIPSPPSWWPKPPTTPAQPPQGCAPSGFTCNGKGNDGYSCDPHGNPPPSYCPDKTWKWYGNGPQWQPQPSWTPPTTWYPPSQWSPKGSPWWKPQKPVKMPKGYTCPSWWPTVIISLVL